jgi:hypothetical protein
MMAIFILPYCFDYITFFKDAAMDGGSMTSPGMIAPSPIPDTNMDYSGRWYASAEDGGLKTRFSVNNTGNVEKAVLIIDFNETRAPLDTVDVKIDVYQTGTYLPFSGGSGLRKDSILLLEGLGSVNKFNLEVTTSAGAPLSSVLAGISVTPAVLYKATKNISPDYLATRIPIKTGPWGYLLFKPASTNIEQVVENLRVKVTVDSEVIELQPFADETGGTPCRTRMVDARGWWSWQFPAGWSYKINEIQVKLGNAAQYGTSIPTTIVAVTDGDADGDALPTHIEVINNIEGISPQGAGGLDPTTAEKSWYMFERLGPNITMVTDLALGAGECWGSILAWFNGNDTTDATLRCSDDVFAHDENSQDQIYIIDVNDDYTYDTQTRLDCINKVVDLTPAGELLSGMYQVQFQVTGKYSSLQLVTGQPWSGPSGQVIPYAPRVMNGREDTDGDNVVDVVESNVGTFNINDRDSDDDGLIDGSDAVPNDKEVYNSGKMDVTFRSGSSSTASCHLDYYLGSHRAHFVDDDEVCTPEVRLECPSQPWVDSFQISAELIITDRYKNPALPVYMRVYSYPQNIVLKIGVTEGQVDFYNFYRSRFETIAQKGSWKYNTPFTIQIKVESCLKYGYFSFYKFNASIDGKTPVECELVDSANAIMYMGPVIFSTYDRTKYPKEWTGCSTKCDVYIDNLDVSWTPGIDASFESQQVARTQIDYPGNQWMLSSTQNVLTSVEFKAGRPTGQSMMGRFKNTDITAQNTINLDYLFSMPSPIKPSSTFPLFIEFDMLIQSSSFFLLQIGDKDGRDWIKASFLSTYSSSNNVLLLQDGATPTPFANAWNVASLYHVKIRIIDGNRWTLWINGSEYGLASGGYRTKNSHLMDVIKTLTISSVEGKSCDVFIDNIKVSWIEGIDERFDYATGKNILVRSPDYVQYKIDVSLEDVSLFSEEWRPWGNKLFSIIPAIRVFGATAEDNPLSFSSGYAIDTLVHSYKPSEDMLIQTTSINESWFDPVQDPLGMEDGTFRDYSISPLKRVDKANPNNYMCTFEFDEFADWDDDDGDMRMEKFIRFDIVYAVYMIEPSKASKLVHVYDYESTFAVQGARLSTISQFAYAAVSTHNYKQQYAYGTYLMKYLGLVKGVKGNTIYNVNNNPIVDFTDNSVTYVSYKRSFEVLKTCLDAGSTLVGVTSYKAMSPAFNTQRTSTTSSWHSLDLEEQVVVSVSNQSGSRRIYKGLSSLPFVETYISLLIPNSEYCAALCVVISTASRANGMLSFARQFSELKNRLEAPDINSNYDIWTRDSEYSTAALDVATAIYLWYSFATSYSTKYQGQFSLEYVYDLLNSIQSTISAVLSCLTLIKSYNRLIGLSDDALQLVGKGFSATFGFVLNIITLLQDINELNKAYETGDASYIAYSTFNVVMSCVSIAISAIAIVAVVGTALGWGCAAALASTCNIVGWIAAAAVVIGTVIFTLIEYEQAERQRQEQLQQLREQITLAFLDLARISVEDQKTVHTGASNYWSLGLRAREGSARESVRLVMDIKMIDFLASLPSDLKSDHTATSGIYWECVREIIPYFNDPNQPETPYQVIAPLYNMRAYFYFILLESGFIGGTGMKLFSPIASSTTGSLTYEISLQAATPELEIHERTWFAGRILKDRNMNYPLGDPRYGYFYRDVYGEIPNPTDTKYAVDYAENFLNLGPVFPATISQFMNKLQPAASAANTYTGTYDFKLFQSNNLRSNTGVTLSSASMESLKGHDNCLKITKGSAAFNLSLLPSKDSFAVTDIDASYDFGDVYTTSDNTRYYMSIPTANRPSPQCRVRSTGHENGFFEFWLYTPSGSSVRLDIDAGGTIYPIYFGNTPDWSSDAWHHVKIRFRSNNGCVFGDIYIDDEYKRTEKLNSANHVVSVKIRTDLSSGTAYVDAFA